MSEIRMKNALSQMKNTSVSERPAVRKHRNQPGEAWSVKCDFIASREKQRLQNYMKNELDLYNSIVDAFNPTSRTSPETFAAFNEKHIQLFMDLVEYSIDIRRLRKNNLPENLKQHEEALFGGSLTERMKILMESAAAPSAIVASTKRNMAKELLKFYSEDSRLRSQKIGRSADQEFKFPPKALGIQTTISKRHLQLLRKDVRIVFDEDKEISKVYIPYIQNPILVDGVNISERRSWNIMIVHQNPNTLAVPSTPWVLDFRGTKNDYLVEYLDNNNDRAGVFHQAKANRSGR